MPTKPFEQMTILEKENWLFQKPIYTNKLNVPYKINSDFIRKNTYDECYRELLVSYLPMLPLLENNVPLEEADYILYMHPYARLHDFSKTVLKELNEIIKKRKSNAEIIIVGKATNIKKYLPPEIPNLTFYDNRFTEKLGKRFKLDIKEQYFVYDEQERHLAIWPVNGCNCHCAFCRRSYMNIPFESISLDYIKKQLDWYQLHDPKKLKTISLRAENLTEYGLDIYHESKLPELIKLLNSYQEIEDIRIRLGLNIGEFNNKMIEAFSKCQKKLTFISIHIEAGSNSQLKQIQKPHTREQALQLLKTLRNNLPFTTFSSNAIIGLPNETEEDIKLLADLIVKSTIDYIAIKPYVVCEQHPLAQLPQLDKKTTEQHLRLLLTEIEKLNFDNQLNDHILIEHDALWNPENIKLKIKIKIENSLQKEQAKLFEDIFIPQETLFVPPSLWSEYAHQGILPQRYLKYYINNKKMTRKRKKKCQKYYKNSPF